MNAIFHFRKFCRAKRRVSSAPTTRGEAGGRGAKPSRAQDEGGRGRSDHTGSGCGSRHASAFLAGVQIALQVPVANDAVLHLPASHLSPGRKKAIAQATPARLRRFQVCRRRRDAQENLDQASPARLRSSRPIQAPACSAATAAPYPRALT